MSIPNILPNPLEARKESTIEPYSVYRDFGKYEVDEAEACRIAAALAMSTKAIRYKPGVVGKPTPVSDQMIQDVAILQASLPENCGKRIPYKEKWHERFLGVYPDGEYRDPTFRDLQSLLPKQPSRHPNPTIRKIEDHYNQTVALVEINTRKFVRKLKAGFQAGAEAAKKA